MSITLSILHLLLTVSLSIDVDIDDLLLMSLDILRSCLSVRPVLPVVVVVVRRTFSAFLDKALLSSFTTFDPCNIWRAYKNITWVYHLYIIGEEYDTTITWYDNIIPVALDLGIGWLNNGILVFESDEINKTKGSNQS